MSREDQPHSKTTSAVPNYVGLNIRDATGFVGLRCRTVLLPHGLNRWLNDRGFGKLRAKTSAEFGLPPPRGGGV